MELTPGQRAVVDHAGGPCRVTGGFGSGKSTALAARRDRLVAEGRRPLLLHHRDLVAFAVALLRRHGSPVSLVDEADQVAIVASLLDAHGDGDRLRARQAATTVAAFQASFLGDEELRVHADAAGCLDRAEELIALTSRYLAVLGDRRLVDWGDPARGAEVGVDQTALVQASLLLRSPEVLAVERGRFDELLLDDFQLATFGTNRLVSQLTGPGAALTVAGNGAAGITDDPLHSTRHLDRFDRRFGAVADIELTEVHRQPSVPTLRIVKDAAEGRQAAREAADGALGLGIERSDVAVIPRSSAAAAVGREWALVIVPDATAGRWPTPRPRSDWFDDELFHGPDVPGEVERDLRWLEQERRRFAVATSRTTRFLMVIGELPVTPFVADLVS